MDGGPRPSPSGPPPAATGGHPDRGGCGCRRRLLAPTFTPARIAGREDLAARVATQLVDDAARQGRFDLVGAVAVPLPVAVIADVLGVPDADAGAFAHWGRAVGAGLGGSARWARCTGSTGRSSSSGP
jgi:cytochrome P450